MKADLDKLSPDHAQRTVFQEIYPVRSNAEAANAERRAGWPWNPRSWGF